MKLTIYTLSALSALLALGSGSALAACSNSSGYMRLNGPDLSTLLTGNTACYPAGGPPWTNQELHSGGNIIDYKKGPSDPVDPSKTIGTYAVTGTDMGVVTYSYTGGGSFSYEVFGGASLPLGNYDFCSGGSPLANGPVKIKSGGGGCP